MEMGKAPAYPLRLNLGRSNFRPTTLIFRSTNEAELGIQAALAARIPANSCPVLPGGHFQRPLDERHHIHDHFVQAGLAKRFGPSG